MCLLVYFFNSLFDNLSLCAFTPLDILIDSFGIQEEKLRCVRLLLDNYANVNIQDADGMTCVFYAIDCNRKPQKSLDVLQLLLNYSNIDINLQLLHRTLCTPYSKGDTILHCAVRNTNMKVVQMILECCC